MKKKSTGGCYALLLSEFKHIFRVMKLSLIFLLLCGSTIFANNVNSQTACVSIEANKLQAKDVIKLKSKQIIFLFIITKRSI